MESGWQVWYYSNSSTYSYPSLCGCWLSFTDEIGPWVASSSSHSPSSIPAVGSTRGGSIGFPLYHSMSALFHSGVTISSRSFGIECIQPAVEVSGELCLSSSCINSSSVVHISSRTCHKSAETSYSNGTMLDGGFLTSHSFQHVWRHSSLVFHCKGSHHRCFGRPAS